MYTETKISFIGNVIFILTTLIILPMLGPLLSRYGILKKIIDIWDEVPTFIHILIIAVYSFLIFIMLNNYIIPSKKSEYEK